MTDKPRLIEAAFPLKQASIDSVHEKNVHHGHISTLHIWPARRPLAASRAALIAALLDDPGTPEARHKLIEQIGGEVVQKGETIRENGKIKTAKKDRTVGGILHWGRQDDSAVNYFRQQIFEKFGRAPRVLDPFSGGGAIPLEAMRMGCEAVAVDINPVAWLILKSTLEYPQKLAGEKRSLPDFAVQNRAFMESYYKARKLSKKQIATVLGSLYESNQLPGMASSKQIDADLAWHVRAWGLWVLEQAKHDLERFFPVIDGKKSIAYLWARTVQCKECRADIPLLKTRWLASKRRIVLTMMPNSTKTGVIFDVNRRPTDAETGNGTLSKSGATCPCCNTINTPKDIRAEAVRTGLGQVMTAVVIEGNKAKEYRNPAIDDTEIFQDIEDYVTALYAEIPFGIPQEPISKGGSRRGGGSPFTVHIYGIDQWYKLFTNRQLAVIGTLIKLVYPR